ncbi:MAG: BatA domain-containing protein [Candidatus Cloacimonas sp.]
MFQLSFLNATLLFFAAATLLPLLIWLLAKKKPQKIVFPSLRFIKLSKEQEKSRSKLKNILLLIIRMLIILLVVLAVARPMFNSPQIKPSAKHPPTAVAILIDTSYSMEYAETGKSALQYAKEALQKINSQANADDRFIPISSDENWNLIHSQIYAGTIPETLIEQLTTTYTPLSLKDMVTAAETKLSESQMPNREIYLISDLRIPPVNLTSSVPIALIPLPQTVGYENLAVISANALYQLVDKRNQQLIQFTVANYGNAERKDVLVKAIVNEIKLAEKFVSIPPRSSITETMTVDLRSDGWQSGFIEINDERQIMDNRCYFAFPFYSKPKIGVITQNDNLPPILATVLKVYSASNYQILSPDELSLNDLDNYQLFVVYNCGPITTRLREIFTNLQNRKIGLLYCLGNDLAADWKSYLNNTFGLDIRERMQKTVTIDNLNAHHYISSLIAGKALKSPTVTDFWQASNKKASVLISAQNFPLAVIKDKQSLWLWNIVSSGIPFYIDPAFPVLAYRTFDYIAGKEIPEADAKIGTMLTFAKLKLPAGEIISSGRYLANEPGIYIFEPDTPRSYAMAINIDYSDSEARTFLPEGVKNLGNNWEGKLFFSRLGYDLWKILLAIAFALMILEIIIIKMEESRAKP